MNKEVNYKVTGAFGSEKIGTIVKAVLLFRGEDSDYALLFHPAGDRYSCASIGICSYDRDEDCYVSSGQDYLNLNEIDANYISVLSKYENSTS